MAKNIDDIPEEELTNEERLAWLRKRGVIVEDPKDVRAAPSPGAPTFTFVRIPVDDNEECEELTCTFADGDALPSHLGPIFAKGASSVTDSALAAHAAAAGQSVDLAVLRTVMEKGGAESFRLAVPTDGNGREGVYAYLDEAAAMKALPRNARASTLAQQCGFPASCVLCGDIYVGRQRWRDGGLVDNVDFRLGELASTSMWVRRAATENLEFQKATQPEEHALAQSSFNADGAAFGECDGYSWRDEREELEVLVKVEKGTTKKDVKIEFRRQEVRVTKPVSLNLKLYSSVEVDGCNWTMGDGQIIITLEKSDADPWPQLLH